MTSVNPGRVFPLSGRVAVLMVVEAAQPGDNYEQGPLTERTLNPKGMQIINAATWDAVGIKCVIGHPHDEHAIAALTTGEKTAKMPPQGPYRGNREAGLFDWARHTHVSPRHSPADQSLKESGDLQSQPRQVAAPE